MAAKKLETASGNSISSLPDEVVGQILSFLPTKTAASTSVLSKRWRNLLPLVHNLDFDESMVLYPQRKAASDGSSFIDFVEKTFALRSDSPIKKFSLKWESGIDEDRVNRLIYNVLERGVLELHLTSRFSQCIETEFFLSKTLVKLTLSNGCYPQGSCPPGGVFFPALKTLSLSSVGFGSYEMYEWLLSSPGLEEFNICDDDPFKSGWVGEVWGSSIKRMTIFYRSHDQEDHSYFTLRTPNLVFLDYSSYVAKDYFLEFDSLVEARLDLRLWKHYEFVSSLLDKHSDYWGDATKLFAAIKNVVTLHLSADSLEVFYFCCKSMPEFNNLVNLSFESHKERGWQVLPLLLEKSPKLKTLAIKGLVHEITNVCGDACVCVLDGKKKEKKNKKMMRTKKKKKKSCCLLSCRVKVLKIYGYRGSCIEVKQMRHFMENLRCLEVVKVEVEVDQQDKFLPLTNELMKLLPAASPKCIIQFI